MISVVVSPFRPTSTRFTTCLPFSRTVTVVWPPAVVTAEEATVSTSSALPTVTCTVAV